MKLLEIAKKFGVKPSKVIGTQGNVVPYKKPSLVDITVDEFKLKESVDKGGITMDKVQQEMEETVRLALSKNLNDVELNRALNNAINIDRQFFPPMAEVVEAGSKQQVTGKGLEELIQKEGLTASPKTPLGQIQLRGKRLEQEAKDLSKEFDIGTLIKGAGRDQLSEIRLHNEGLVRAVTRQILSEDIKAGKIKGLTLENLGTSREPIDYFRKIYGEDALERLDSLAPDFNKLNTEQEAASLARSKFKFEPDETRTKGSISYDELEKNIQGSGQTKEAELLDITTEGNKRKSIDDLIDEYNANQDKLSLSDAEGGTEISYDEFNDLKKKNQDIAKALEEKGISSTIEEEVKPEGIIIPFRKKFPKPEPEGKAQGGIIGYAMGGNVERQGYFFGGLTGRIRDMISKIVRPVQTAEQSTQPEIPLSLNERYRKYLSEAENTTTSNSSSPIGELVGRVIKGVGISTSQGSTSANDFLYNLYKKNVEGKADGGRIGFKKGKRVLDIITNANENLKGKKSMDTINPKTGEVTTPRKAVKRAEEPTGITVMNNEPDIVNEKSIKKTKSRQLTREEISDYEEQLGDSETWMSEGTVEEAEKALKRSKAEEAYMYRQYKAGKLDPEPGENSPSRMRFLRKKAEEAEMTGDRRLISSDEMDELSDLESTYLNNVDEAYGMDTAIKKEMKKAMEEGVLKTNRMTELGLDPSNSKDYDKFLEMESIKQKYGNVIDDNLLQKIMVDDNPQRKAEVLASMDEAIKMQEKGIAPEEIINIMKNTTRTKQAKGGSAGGLDYLMGF